VHSDARFELRTNLPKSGHKILPGFDLDRAVLQNLNRGLRRNFAQKGITSNLGSGVDAENDHSENLEKASMACLDV